MPTTRLATPQDMNGLAALYRSQRPLDPPLREDTHAPLLNTLCHDPRTRLVVQDRDGELVATCMLAIVPNLAHGGRPFGLIEHVVTLPDWRADKAMVGPFCRPRWTRPGRSTATRSCCSRA